MLKNDKALCSNSLIIRYIKSIKSSRLINKNIAVVLYICGNSSINLKLKLMKTKKIKIIAGFVVLVFFALSTFGQTPTKATKESAKKPVKLEKSKVPKAVTETFYVEYPDILDDWWYGYPVYDYGDYWYDDWYDPYVYTEYPDYYVVEYIQDNTPSKAVYSKAGKKVAVHKSVTDLPKAVTEAISKGNYKTWKIGKDKEEIFKDKDKDQLKVYKVNMEMGKEKHTLFFQQDGKLLKDKKLS